MDALLPAPTGESTLTEEKRALYNSIPPLITGPRRGLSKRDRVLQWVEMRSIDPSLSTRAIAERLGISSGALKAHIDSAAKEGWLQFADPIERMDHEIIPLVMNNLKKFLEDKDKTVTVETAKGTVFKTYQDAKGISDAPQTMLALKIETVDPENAKILTGHIVGKPRRLEE